MPQALIKFLSRANICMDENNGSGNDLPGGGDAAAAEKAAAEKAAAEKAAADKAAADKAAAEKAEADRLAAEQAGKGDKDKPQPSDAEAKLLKEVMERKASEKALKEQLAALTGSLGDLKADDIAKLVQEKKDRERADLEKRGEYDRILEQVKGEHAKVIETLQTEIASLKGETTKRADELVELTVGRSFSESQFIRDRSVLPASIARREFGAYVDLVDGVPVVHDKPRGAAERTPLVGADGKPKSFEEGIAALYEKHPDSKSLLKALGNPGAGSHTNTDVKNGQQRQGENLTGLQRIQAALNKNGGKA